MNNEDPNTYGGDNGYDEGYDSNYSDNTDYGHGYEAPESED